MNSHNPIILQKLLHKWTLIQKHRIKNEIQTTFITKYLTIKDWDYNCQKHQNSAFGHFKSALHTLFQLFFFNLTSHLSFSYLISGTFILSYSLVFNHLVLNLNKSHNTLKKNWEAKTKLLYFVQLAGLKKMCASVCTTVFTRLILTCQISEFWCCWTFYYKLIVSNDETCLSIAKNW